MCGFVCVFQKPVQPITLSCMVGFKKRLAQMISMTGGCVTNKNRVARLKVKVTVGSFTLPKDLSETCSCPTYNFVIHGGI